MEVILIVLAILLIAGGVVFSVLPPLPGPLLSYGAVIVSNYLAEETSFSHTFLIVTGILALAVIVADYVLPIMATKKFGGTKAGVWGGMIGVVVGFILPIPFGVIIGPLLGAIIGDLYGGNHIRSAFKSGFGSFIGFLIGTSVKVLFSIVLGVMIIWKIGEFTYTTILQSI